MANSKKPLIRLTSREYDTIKEDLINHAKINYEDTVRGFNKGSVNSYYVDIVSYVGDILNYYIDYSTNEMNPLTAFEPRNIIRQAKSRGYKFVRSPSSYGKATLYITVPANASGIGPNTNYIPILRKGSQFTSRGGVPFMLNEDVDFANPSNQIVVATVDQVTGAPTNYAIRAYGQILSGRILQQTFIIGDYEKFKRIRLTDTNISEILRVTDSDGREYYEVQNLSQDVVYKSVVNRDTATNELATNILKPYPVPRRFVVENEPNETYLVFGQGSPSDLDSSTLTDPSAVVMQVYGKDYISDSSFDPKKLIESDKLGIAPVNTTLTVVYRTNGSSGVNAGAGSVRTVESAKVDFGDSSTLSPGVISFVQQSLTVDNDENIIGDVSFPTSEELRRRMIGSYTTQDRAVTSEDYVTAAYAMPGKFGAIKRVSLKRDLSSFKRNLNLYVLCEDAGGSLIAANTAVKKNLKTWLLSKKMINDTIDILDGRIINIGINFEVASTLEANAYDLLERCITALQLKFKDKFDIGEPLLYQDIYRTLNKVEGVADTTKVEIINKNGGIYSDVKYNIRRGRSPDGKILTVPEDAVLEIKFPTIDIRGRVK